MKRQNSGKGKGPEKVTVGNVTVKVYHRTRGKYDVFEVADYSAGTRRLRSFSTRGEARREAERVARLMAAGEATAAQIRGSDAASYGRALELLRPSGDTLELAVSRYAEAVKVLGTGERLMEAARYFAQRNPDTLPQRTVAQVAEELLAAKASRGKSARYLQDLKSRLGRFADSFRVGIAEVQAPDVQRWLDGLKLAPQSAKNFRTVVGTLFKFAEARGYVVRGENPVERTERLSANGGDVVIYSPAEIARLLAAASPDFLPALAIGAFAGLRSAEVERLEWSDVDLAGGFVTVGRAKAKTASRRLVPIADNLRQWLAPYANRTGRIWQGTHRAFYVAQQETAQAAGLEWKPNALRHSYASYRLAATHDAAKVSMECGNSPQVVFRHYRELVKPDAAKAWFTVSPEGPQNVVAMKEVANG